MRISDIDLATVDGRLRAEATILWEEADRLPFLWYVETEPIYQQIFWPNPNAWLLGAILPAWHAGEERVQVEGTLCPVLLANLKIALGVLENWFPELGSPPIVEALGGITAFHPQGTESMTFLSGGVDSMATLRWNKLHLPSDHPRSITGALYVEFLEGASAEQSLTDEILLRRKCVHRVADSAGIDAFPATTNIWELDGDGWFYSHKWHGAALSAMAHFFSRRFNRAYLASSAYQNFLPLPWGSHPLLDTRYSSGDMYIEHDGLQMFRSQKIALVAEWPTGLHNLLVCQNQPVDGMNCGECNKCILTMTSLLALEKLREAESFPVQDITAELLATLVDYDMLDGDYMLQYYERLIPALTAKGRDDLVSVILRFRPHMMEKRAVDEQMAAQLGQLIPSDHRFVVADNHRFQDVIGDEPRGRYWGLPRDSATATRELRQMARSGVRFFVFTPETSWWLDHFNGLLDHLDDTHYTVQHDHHTVVYRFSD